MTNKKQIAKWVLLSAAWAVSVFVLWPRVKQVNATVTHEFSDSPESETTNHLYGIPTDRDLEEDALRVMAEAAWNSDPARTIPWENQSEEFQKNWCGLFRPEHLAVLDALRKLAEPDD